jgi:hypothetical protein
MRALSLRLYGQYPRPYGGTSPVLICRPKAAMSDDLKNDPKQRGPLVVIIVLAVIVLLALVVLIASLISAPGESGASGSVPREWTSLPDA